MRTLVLVALIACNDAAKPRERGTTSTQDTTRPATAGEARLLRYQPANMPRYQVVATAKTPPGSVMPIEIARAIELELVADERYVRARVSDTDPLAAYDLGDAADAAVLLFPELPDEPVARGTQWMVKRGVRVPGADRFIDLAHTVLYGGTTVCSSGVRTCARLAVDAEARNAVLRIDGVTWLVVYSFSGTIILDTERGIVEEARLNARANVANGPANVTIEATLFAKPSAARD